MSFADVYDPSGTVTAPTINFPVIVSATAPVSPLTGTAWLNTTSNELSVWDGAVWVVSSGGSSLPQATAEDQLLKAGAAPNFPWTLSTDLDSGRF